jgi:hypothetical protein
MKKEYEAPTLKVWGSVETLTAVGRTREGTDFHSGSVNPPGHENKPV